uniref:Transcriptional regulator, LysR family n=1 Tax=Caulobacter sp. (strain K31) TaxID=366602 RepID=B0SV78_CAUSK
MNAMNLNQLRFAGALAAHGSFTAAASECCVTQPTLSNSIAQLEDELGGRLFMRTTRKVGLTPLGEHVLPYIKEVLNAQATLIGQTKAFLHPARRLIRIGTSPLIDAALLGVMLEPFREKNPEVELIFRELNMSDLHRMLDEGLLDYVFGVVEAQRDRWSTAFLYDEPLLFIPRGTSQREVRNGPVRLKDISDETYVMVPDACGLSRATRTFFRSERRKLKEYTGEALSYQVLQDWASLGIGAAILPKSKVVQGRNAGQVIEDKSGKEVRIAFEAVWSREDARSPHLLGFENHLLTVAARVGQGIAQR